MAATTDKQADAGTDPAITWIEQRAKAFSEDADDLRASTDRAAKVLTALASAGLTAVGIAKVGAVYPWPAHEAWLWIAVIVLFAGFVLMAASVVWFVIRFWKANRPLAMSTDKEGLVPRYMDSDEFEEVERIYEDAIRHAPFTKGPKEPLAGYEDRADRWEEDALLTPDSPISKRRLAQVARMRAEIERAEQRAKLVVVRRRMNYALTRRITILIAMMFLVGLISFAVAADRLESERARTACIDALKNSELTELPPICKTYVR